MTDSRKLASQLPLAVWDDTSDVFKVRVIRLLAESALDHLSQEPAPCSPDECASCWALRELLNTGHLDALLHHTPAGIEWWDHQTKVVDRDWLARHWAAPETTHTPQEPQ